MNIEALIASKMETRKAAGLLVTAIYEGRCDYNYYAKDVADRDRTVRALRALIGRVDECGHKIVDVVIG